MSSDYSIARARSSLVHFSVGKIAAALSGLAVLLLTLRLVPAPVFGAHVALLAVTEIFYLVSGFGLSYFAQRYVPQLRMRAPPLQFNRQLRGLLSWRTGLALAFALPLCLAAPAWGRWLEMPLGAAITVFFGVNLVLGSIMRYIDELLQALLLQGWAQLQSVVRNLVRLAVLAAAGVQALAIDLLFMVALEALVATLAALAGLIMIGIYLRRRRPEQPGTAVSHTIPGAWQQALRYYGAQVLAQCYGANAVKLIVTTVLGLQATAILGFAHSLTDLLRNYSPAFLLSGWIRPLMVSRYVDHGSAGVLKPLSRLLITVSVVGLLPFAVVSAVFGAEISAFVGVGKYPQAAGLLAPLVVAACLQSAHTILGMVCATVERANFVLIATGVCLVTLPLAYVLSGRFGVAGTVATLLLSEVLWIATVVGLLAWSLGEKGFADVRRLAGAVLLAAAAGLLLAWVHGRSALASPVQWMVASCVAAVAYWALAWYARVLGPEERELVARFLKRQVS